MSRHDLRQVATTGLMLFALFFGAGNLIFPPSLGASSGDAVGVVVIGFIATGVILPLLGVIAVSTSGEGILGLARRVGPRFGRVLPLVVYLSIGPLYAIPRTAIVSYELATRPLLELAGMPTGRVALALHAVGFFAVALALSLRPSRMADSIGKLLTPALLILIAVLCAAAVMSGPTIDRPATGAYATAPLAAGLTQGYLTMDALAATVFGIVVITTLRSQGMSTERQILWGTSGAGVIAAICLAAVYGSLALLGMRADGDPADGTSLLRAAAADSLGPTGTVVFALIVVLACLSTAIGLISSWAGYANTAWPRIDFRAQAIGCSAVSLALTNLGLSAMIVIISPVTLLLYPIVITLIVVTLIDSAAPGHLRWTYRVPVSLAAVLGAVSAAAETGWSAPSDLLARTGAWDNSIGWILPVVIVTAISIGVDIVTGRWSRPASDTSDVPDEVRRAIASRY
ncbi:branched-chain amino acid transport system II carrier protein [Actinomyces timonensis]|uniref:Branched-chain amino acid transport system II carrier protein n=1 Tax=Actinomyces timonensis TaxID=1288391 RepID=A0AAU8N4F1_9ACTO